jgi:hypothetical protein
MQYNPVNQIQKSKIIHLLDIRVINQTTNPQAAPKPILRHTRLQREVLLDDTLTIISDHGILRILCRTLATWIEFDFGEVVVDRPGDGTGVFRTTKRELFGRYGCAVKAFVGERLNGGGVNYRWGGVRVFVALGLADKAGVTREGCCAGGGSG